jgi:hypothetical protein
VQNQVLHFTKGDMGSPDILCGASSSFRREEANYKQFVTSFSVWWGRKVRQLIGFEKEMQIKKRILTLSILAATPRVFFFSGLFSSRRDTLIYKRENIDDVRANKNYNGEYHEDDSLTCSISSVVIEVYLVLMRDPRLLLDALISSSYKLIR